MTEAPAPAPPSAAAPPTRPKRRRTPWIIGGSIAVVLALIAAVAVPMVIAGQRHAAAEASYRAAGDDYDKALDVARDAVRELEAAQASALDTRALADEVVTVADPAYVDVGALQALIAAQAALTEALEVSDAAPDEPRRLGAAPDDTEALARRADEIAAQVDDVQAAGEQYAELAVGVEAADTATDAAGEAFMASLAGSVASVDAAFVSATNAARIDYRAAAEPLGAGEWDTDAAAAVSGYVAAATVLAQSHLAEEAQKAGPLYANRRAVEEFARSIAGGVMLDFDWAPIVNGYGAGGSYGGTATWNTAHGGYSTITLSDSVAALWQGNPAVASLVAHEVGHSITGKCIDLFKSGFGSQPEVFATAWAIGLGYDRDGSGESIYGRPTDALIELSKQCR